MNDEFDELAKGLAQSITRKQALKKFGVGLAGIALAAVGLPKTAQAGRECYTDADCPSHQRCDLDSGHCFRPRKNGP